MKGYQNILLICAMALLSNCEKGLWKDEELTLHRQNNNGEELRLDGYFYTQFRDI